MSNLSEEEITERIDKVIADYEQTIEELYNELDRYRKLYNEEKEKNKLIKFDGAEFIKDSKGNLHIVTGGVVSKDKIKDKIKELENGKPFWLREEERKGALFILKELLEGE